MSKTQISAIVPLGFKRKLSIPESARNQIEPIELIVEVGKNPPENRNRGIKKANTPFVAFVDAHTLLPKEWSQRVLSFFDKHPEIDMVGGPQLNYPGDTRFAHISGYALSSIFGAAESSSRYKIRETLLDVDEKYVTSANLICRRRVVDKVKFDESLWPGEDPKFVSDVKKAGFRIAFSPEIFVYHVRRPTFKDLAKQVFEYGAARPKKESFFQTLQKPSFIVPSVFLLYLALFPLLSMIHWLFALPPLLYLIFNAIFSIFEGARNHDAGAILILPLIFFTIHVGYGAGFIYGVISKILWRRNSH